MKKNIYEICTLLFIVLLASPVLADIGDNDFGMMGGFCGSNTGYGMGFLGSIIMLLIIVLLVLAIIWLYKQIQKK